MSPTRPRSPIPRSTAWQMTGTRLKEILEDVADNLFNPDPYYQQGGDMVRIGGMAYAIDITKPTGAAHLGHALAEDRQADRPVAGAIRSRAGRASTKARRDRRSGRLSPSHLAPADRPNPPSKVNGACQRRPECEDDVTEGQNSASAAAAAAVPAPVPRWCRPADVAALDTACTPAARRRKSRQPAAQRAGVVAVALAMASPCGPTESHRSSRRT